MTSHVWKKTTARPSQRRLYFKCHACGTRVSIEDYRETPNAFDLNRDIRPMTCSEVAILSVMDS